LFVTIDVFYLKVKWRHAPAEHFEIERPLHKTIPTKTDLLASSNGVDCFSSFSWTMTVASLWKALDKANCGKPVGARELMGGTRGEVNSHPKPTVLAVDLSIWICESLASLGMREQHSNPVLYLVFTRTMKLLNLGIRLVFVLEGKRRIRDFNNVEKDKFRKRRSGNAFWKACKDCQFLLELIGIPVVKAKYEGESLCALLNERGVVDGVISNDGDCLLFGAKTIYTKFSCENLEKGCIMRYDADKLRAIVDVSDDKDIAAAEVGTVTLSRHDLITFALLTGSDLAGPGLKKTGHKKAIRFIRKCQLDFPLTKETASLDELKSWANAASGIVNIQDECKNEKCCSRCNHNGSKRSHLKHGCVICGTEPGEQCFLVTSEDRFRQSLRAKALELQPKFDPSQVYSAYMRPNDNQLPIQLVGAAGSGMEMGYPKIKELCEMNLIVKGQSLVGSRDFVRQTVSRYVTRYVLMTKSGNLANFAHERNVRDRPIAREIVKALTKDRIPCYQVIWDVNANFADENGEGVDGYDYATFEPREFIEKHYPDLVKNFLDAEQEREKQGDGQKNKRRAFIENFLLSPEESGFDEADDDIKKKQRKAHHVKQREEFFQNKVIAIKDFQATARKRRRHQQSYYSSDDVGNILRFASSVPLQLSPTKSKWFEHSSIESFSFDSPLPPETKLKLDEDVRKFVPFLRGKLSTPARVSEALFVTMGCYEVEVTPIDSNRGAYPPKHIFVRA
jgi:flap endonuclease GEN